MTGHVAIVGAGPAGALLAYLLARGGVRVTLLERHTDFSREFRGEGMSPSGMAAIREAGLWQEFDALPATRLRSMALYSSGKPFLDLDVERILPQGMQFIRVLSQSHLLEMLVEKSSQFEGFTLKRGAVVQEVVRDGNRVTGLGYAQDGALHKLDVDYVVAADGRFSTIRRQLGLELGGKRQQFDVVWCKVPRPEAVPEGRVYSFLLDDFFGLIFPTEHDQLQIGRIIPKGSYRTVRADGDWYDRVLEILPDNLKPGFASVRAHASDPALLDVICGSMPEWSVAGACFIGDAAHPMSPIGAQGINIALRDAVIAANHLGPAFVAGASAPALDAAAKAFEAERRPEVDKIQSQQNDAPGNLAKGRRAAPILRLIPKSWISGLARFVMSRRSTRNFIEGTTSLRLTFGAPD